MQPPVPRRTAREFDEFYGYWQRVIGELISRPILERNGAIAAGNGCRRMID